MKKDNIMTFVTVLLGIFSLYIYGKPVYNLLDNITLDYAKEVYLGGDNIVLDYIVESEDDSVVASNYATIGTITYIDEDGNFGAVGHSINATGFENGNIFIAPVDSVIKTTNKRIGEKNVYLGNWTSDGLITDIRSTGVYGTFSEDTNGKNKVLVGMPKDIELSEALLYTNVKGNEVKAYKIQIEKVYYTRTTHNIYIRIIDPELLNETGGVIQGMSGSPIVQDGKIIGSLSHVDDKNPECGYGLFITYMI